MTEVIVRVGDWEHECCGGAVEVNQIVRFGVPLLMLLLFRRIGWPPPRRGARLIASCERAAPIAALMLLVMRSLMSHSRPFVRSPHRIEI